MEGTSTIASAFSENITALATLATAAALVITAVYNGVKLRKVHRNTDEINHAVNGKSAGAVSIQQQIQALYDNRPPDPKDPEAGLVLAVHALLAKLEAIDKRIK